MRISFDIGDLEAFLAVKDTGSFHAAAQAMNLSQPAITRRIQKLEEALDTVLFDRSTRAVRPTLAAKRLQARAQAIVDGAEEAARAMRDESIVMAHQRTLLLTVAIIPTVIPGMLPRVFQHLNRQNLHPRVRILDLTANGVAEAVAQGEADVGLCSIPELEPATRFEPVFEDRIVLAFRPDHPFASQKALSWQALRDQSLIGPSRGTGNRILIDEAMGRANLPLHWHFEVGRSTTALELVRGGTGVALVPQTSLTAVEGQDLAWRPMRDPDIARPIGLISRWGHVDSPTCAAFKAAVRLLAAERREGGLD